MSTEVHRLYSGAQAIQWYTGYTYLQWYTVYTCVQWYTGYTVYLCCYAAQMLLLCCSWPEFMSFLNKAIDNYSVSNPGRPRLGLDKPKPDEGLYLNYIL